MGANEIPSVHDRERCKALERVACPLTMRLDMCLLVSSSATWRSNSDNRNCVAVAISATSPAFTACWRDLVHDQLS